MYNIKNQGARFNKGESSSGLKIPGVTDIDSIKDLTSEIPKIFETEYNETEANTTTPKTIRTQTSALFNRLKFEVKLGAHVILYAKYDFNMNKPNLLGKLLFIKDGEFFRVPLKIVDGLVYTGVSSLGKNTLMKLLTDLFKGTNAGMDPLKFENPTPVVDETPAPTGDETPAPAPAPAPGTFRQGQGSVGFGGKSTSRKRQMSSKKGGRNNSASRKQNKKGGAKTRRSQKGGKRVR
jgi:hypothetical protein